MRLRHRAALALLVAASLAPAAALANRSVTEVMTRMYELGCIDARADGTRPTEVGALWYKKHLRTCQARLGLAETGAFDGPTQRKLFPPPAPSADPCDAAGQAKWLCKARKVYSRDDDRTVFGASFEGLQKFLAQYGCLNGTPSRTWSVAHFEAVQCFQRDIGAEPTGMLTAAQVRSLQETLEERRLAAVAKAEDTLLSRYIEVVDTPQGQFAHVGTKRCRGIYVFDVTHSSAENIHVLRNVAQRPPAGCKDLDFVVDFFAHQLFPGARGLTLYSLRGWDGRDLNALGQHPVITVTFHRLRPLDPDWNFDKLRYLIREDRVKSIREVLPRLPMLTEDPQATAARYVRQETDLPGMDQIAPPLRASVGALLDEVRAALPAARAAQQAELGKLGTPVKPCRESAIRLVYCTMSANLGGQPVVMCGGNEAGRMLSPARKCPQVSAHWCDVFTGRLFARKNQGIAAICPQ